MNDNVKKIIQLVFGMLFKKEVSISIPIETAPETILTPEKQPEVEKIDSKETDLGIVGVNWADPTAKVSKYFTVAEVATLHAWNRLATIEDGLTEKVQSELIKFCLIMDQVRELLGCPIDVHCGFRSVKYNTEVLHSLPNDVHSVGKAIDFDVYPHLTIEEAKAKIRPVLEKLNIRMEGGTSSWIHLDGHSVGPSGREFKT